MTKGLNQYDVRRLIVKSRKGAIYNARIALKFGRSLDSSAAETLAKFQNYWKH